MNAWRDGIIIVIMKSRCGSARPWSAIEKQLDRTCDQLKVLHHRIEKLRVRQQRYTKHGSCAFVHCLQLELQVVERVYAMYYKYGEMKAVQLMELDRGSDQQGDRCGLTT